MKKAAIGLFGITMLSACELLVIPAAPIVGTAIAVDYLSKFDQPLKVIGPSGNTLAEPFDPSTKPYKKVRISSSALTCSGGTRIKCKTGQTGRVSIQSAPPLGSSFAADMDLSASAKVNCRGNFYPDGPSAGPFGVDCSYRFYEWADFYKTEKVWVTVTVTGAAMAQKTPSGSSQFTLWIPPAN